MTDPIKIGIIGGGNMGASLAGGFVSHGYLPGDICIAEHHEHKRIQLEKKWSVKTTSDNQEAARGAHILILAVKPQSMPQLVQHITAVMDLKNTLLISVAAGITTQQIQRWAPYPVKIIRAMPNTPALIGKGMTALFASNDLTLTLKQRAENLMQTVGETVWIEDEALMNIVTALSGSGPAYFFYFIEELIHSAITLGLPAEIASKLTLKTAQGSVQMALESLETITQLRENVTSPGGTTEQGINVLKNGKIGQLLLNTLTAAALRGKTLSEQFD